MPLIKTKSKLAVLVSALDDVDFLEHVAFGKARRKKLLPSVLTEPGFIRRLLSVANRLRRGVVVGTKEFEERALAESGIDWPRASTVNRKKAISAMTNLVRNAPSEFAPGVRVVLDTETKKILSDVHGALGKKHKEFTVDPLFASKNQPAVDAMVESTSVHFAKQYEQQADRFRERAQRVLSEGLADGLGRREIARDLQAEFTGAVVPVGYWETVAAAHTSRARSFSEAATYAENGVTQYEILAILDVRTTSICEMMNGTILSVESALNSFDAFEQGASDVDQVKVLVPFMRVVGGEVRVGQGEGTRVATVTPDGFTNKLSSGAMNENGINMPPFHHRCRTDAIPVL